jgi:arginyl-tRNA synthetase
MKKYISEIINTSLKKIGLETNDIILEKPKEEKFGDLSSNIALLFSKKLKTNPRNIAEEIINNLDYDKNLISKIEIAGTGFINFYISDFYYKNNLNTILNKKSAYGKSDIYKDKTANIEWVSVNPTGPLHTGHGRGICLGKAIANILECVGYTVTREYYYNDAGNQMINLALSIKARYNQIYNSDYPFPDDGYAGEYIKDVAQTIDNKYGDKFVDSEDLDIYRNEGEVYNFKKIRSTLEKLDIHHDEFFNETTVYKNKDVYKLLDLFKEKELSYEQEGAVWLKLDRNKGFKSDKVIVKATGEPTYRLPDMAYHIDKIKRGYDLILDIFGSDHSDTYKEVLYGVESAGYDISNIKVIIHQMVSFKKGEETVKMSKRGDDVYYLDDLIKDIGVDATQFFFVMRNVNTHLDFDIKLAKEQSEKNPVYYLQYAHARICGILRNADENFPDYKETNIDNIDFDLIQSGDEINLLKVLERFPDEVLTTASTYEPHKLITYLNSVAENFHRFYHNNRVLNLDDKETTITRLQICLATKQVLKNGFDIIGISAPDRM